MESNFIDSMTCPICFELADNAVETSCCHHVFCERCLMQVVNQGCPQCRAPFRMEVSHLSRRIIGNLPVKCCYQGCKAKLTKSEQKEHEAKCQHRLYICPAQGCSFEGLRKDFATHLAWQHEQNVVQNACLIFKESEELAEAAKKEDRIATRKNASGRECRLGSTGKYYCGARLDGPQCGCCNGRCGPTNGCNCSACMKMDVKLQLMPRNWYVNRDGYACRISPDTGSMYCGRLMLPKTRLCDGYCGPTNGPNCEACRILQTQLDNRYASIWR